MAKEIKKNTKKNKGLSDKELVAKYDTGESIELGSILKITFNTVKPDKK